jgi:hypothetical protein
MTTDILIVKVISLEQITWAIPKQTKQRADSAYWLRPPRG